MNSTFWRDCKGCKRRYNDLGEDGLCAPCHNARIDNRERARGTLPKPAWCGKCDERTRLYEWEDESRIAKGYDPTVVSRCPRCHPLAGARRPDLRLAG